MIVGDGFDVIAASLFLFRSPPMFCVRLPSTMLLWLLLTVVS